MEIVLDKERAAGKNAEQVGLAGVNAALQSPEMRRLVTTVLDMKGVDDPEALIAAGKVGVEFRGLSLGELVITVAEEASDAKPAEDPVLVERVRVRRKPRVVKAQA